ncbi:hypothetical protein AQUCO_01600290v1 [Aquilegia coerulea]|uniref:Glutathione peroxidase n=1 Tax=Aquilegia coerulea TaxID=218851 RepID=A0A2G5DR14_AQUCA|nr:hypothetical protein AQUCO_01600290v1 [Aquilegia coerulea]
MNERFSHVVERHPTVRQYYCCDVGMECGSQIFSGNLRVWSPYKQIIVVKLKVEKKVWEPVRRPHNHPEPPKTDPVQSSTGGFLGDVVKWNFEKFLVDKNGKVVERYAPTTSPFQIEKDIQKLLAA